MNQQAYIDRRSERDPEFRQELAIATAELKLATTIAEQRIARDIAPGALCENEPSGNRAAGSDEQSCDQQPFWFGAAIGANVQSRQLSPGRTPE